MSGRFGSSIEVGSGKHISKRNSTVYASVLGGRLIGVGYDRLSLYHACLGIPSCPTASTFSKVEVDILAAAESIASIDYLRVVTGHRFWFAVNLVM